MDIEAGYKGVELMKQHVARTRIPGVVSGIGGFGGLFAPDLAGMKEPVLVSGTDGVGTKLRLAQLLDRHDTIGIDCVAMCVNDIICCGARPLFFLDYIAIGKNEAEKVASIVSGVAEGCVRSGCALIGGETAEHPGVMDPDDYDIAGFAVGIVDREKIIDGGKVSEGDVLIGLASSGVHSNGFSLVRKVFDIEHADLPEGLGVKILPNAIPKQPIFDLIQKRGNISDHDMYNTFNMGLGMVLAVPLEQGDRALELLAAAGEQDAACVGIVTRSDGGVSFDGL